MLLNGAAVTGFILDGASYDSISFSVSSEEANPYGLFFKPDGTKMYVVGTAGDDVNEYDLSVAWDITTASYLQNFSVASQETVPSGVSFSSDGTKMYVIVISSDAVNEYSLSTAWDVSTASYTQNFSVAAQDTAPEDVTFKPDGTKMYVVSQDVHEYDLSTAWDVSTASHVRTAVLPSATSIFFKPDGTKMYLSTSTVTEYDLSTAWDISTASLSVTLSGLEETIARGLFFKVDGTKMYIVGGTNDTVYQYSTATPATITYDTNIQWAGGTAPTSPAIGETDVLTFTTRDGGTTYNAALAIDGAQ